jgi:nucleoside-diphosphate-sugar epimerase
VVSTAEACNRICALAGIDHRVQDVAPSDDPELLAVFGPTLIAIAFKLQSVQTPRRNLTESKTYKRLGYEPISLDEGLQRTAEWLREIGRIEPLPQ